MMPQYYFTIRWVDRVGDDTRGESLSDDTAALNYACRMASELQTAPPAGKAILAL
jgi:hypothetical protein